jgi:thiosulfate dehydrogenase [quinone] large subunit
MGFLKGRIEDYSSPLAGVPARLYTGYFFFTYGLQKVTGGFGGPALRQTLEGWVAQTRYRFYVPFLQNLAIPYADVLAWLVIFGEIGVGVALLLGLASRFAALVGAFLCLNFLFASGVPLLSVEQPVVFTVLLVTIYATAAGRALGLDAFLARRLPGWVA